MNYIILLAWSASFSDALDTRQLVGTALFVCSRMWLLLFLGWRAHSRGGDSRFDKVPRSNPSSPWATPHTFRLPQPLKQAETT